MHGGWRRVNSLLDGATLAGSALLATGPWQYAAWRFVAGAANMSAILTNFALGIEWVPERWRPSLAAFFFSCSALGEFMTVLVALGVAAALRSSGGWRQLTLVGGPRVLSSKKNTCFFFHHSQLY